MKDMEILCNIIFLDRYGIFLGLHYRWNTNIYSGPMELSSFQEGLLSIGDGTLELPNPGRETNFKILIITGYYCVCNTSGDSSAWTLQSIFMKDQQSKTDRNPRKQFIRDLIVYINQKQSQNHEIILNLDTNEALGEESRGIAKLMRECNLVDLHDIPEMEPEEQLQDTYR